tara:strand:+ start:3759 stop:4004 length:246 start_codon:yes stop_codon:yes gene_type:complete
MVFNKKNVNQLMIQAHKEKNISLLVELYAQASKSAANCDLACFLATQAYVMALETDNPISEDLFNFLLANDREVKFTRKNI